MHVCLSDCFITSRTAFRELVQRHSLWKGELQTAPTFLTPYLACTKPANSSLFFSGQNIWWETCCLCMYSRDKYLLCDLSSKVGDISTAFYLFTNEGGGGILLGLNFGLGWPWPWFNLAVARWSLAGSSLKMEPKYVCCMMGNLEMTSALYILIRPM